MSLSPPSSAIYTQSGFPTALYESLYPKRLSCRRTTCPYSASPRAFWLTLLINNIGQSQVRDIAADLMLLPGVSAIYPGCEAFVGTPAVVTESTGQTRATFALLSLAPGNAHTIFVALRSEGLTGPPYEAPAQRQWVAQHRAYWEHFTVTAEQHTRFEQYGFAVPLRVWQVASDPVGASASQGAPRSAARSAP